MYCNVYCVLEQLFTVFLWPLEILMSAVVVLHNIPLSSSWHSQACVLSRHARILCATSGSQRTPVHLYCLSFLSTEVHVAAIRLSVDFTP
jgi:hypothetical protein